jgi:hypothetical protein
MTDSVKTTPGEIPLPKEYVALGLRTGYNPRPVEDARIYLTGLAGEGKSTFISSIPDAWLIDFEGGAEGIPGRRGSYFDIRDIAKKTGKDTFTVYRSVLEKLLADGKAGRRPCKRVILDTHDGWVEMEGRHLLAEKSTPTKVYEDIGELGMKGHGHSLLQGRCRRILGDLEDAGYTWAVVGHLTYTVETDPITYKESTKIRPVLSKGYVGPVVRMAELHVTIYSSTRMEKVDRVIGGKTIRNATEKQVTRYHLFTRPTEAKTMEGKRRGVPNLPGKMEVPMVGGWEVLKKAYNEAVDESMNTSTGETE